ncbi:MAG: hypothetical protein ABSF71_23405, partial [Terriglobia bacterium]
RAQPFFEKLGVGERLRCIPSGGGQGEPGSAEALETFLRGLGVRDRLKPLGREPRDLRVGFDPDVRLHRQFKQLVDFTLRSGVIPLANITLDVGDVVLPLTLSEGCPHASTRFSLRDYTISSFSASQCTFLPSW